MFQATKRPLALPLPLTVITTKVAVGNHAATPSRRQHSLLIFFKLCMAVQYIFVSSCHEQISLPTLLCTEEDSTL